MGYLRWLTGLIVITVALPVQALDIAPLSACSMAVFREIRKTHAWSGKPPEGCSGTVRVEKRTSGVFVTVWLTENFDQGWLRIALSSAMGFYELADKNAFAAAGRDIAARSSRIERCLNSIVSVNDPLECRDHATKSYRAGEVVGIEHDRLVWLDDNGRHTVVELAYGDTSVPIAPPADLFGGQALPPGLSLDLHIRDAE